jgi:hypothetical protein
MEIGTYFTAAKDAKPKSQSGHLGKPIPLFTLIAKRGLRQTPICVYLECFGT